MVALYDPRLPMKSQRVLLSRELESSIVSLSLLTDNAGETPGTSLRLIAGAKNGEIRIWEPRMFRVRFCMIFTVSEVYID